MCENGLPRPHAGFVGAAGLGRVPTVSFLADFFSRHTDKTEGLKRLGRSSKREQTQEQLGTRTSLVSGKATAAVVALRRLGRGVGLVGGLLGGLHSGGLTILACVPRVSMKGSSGQREQPRGGR